MGALLLGMKNRVPPVAYAESFRGGPKSRHNCVTSQINFMESAEGTENRNAGGTPNTRKKPALLLLKLLGFALHFLLLGSEGGHRTVASHIGTVVGTPITNASKYLFS